MWEKCFQNLNCCHWPSTYHKFRQFFMQSPWADLGLASVVVFSEDDALSLHVKAGDQTVGLKGQGAAPYLDAAQIVAAALAAGCDAIRMGEAMARRAA